MNDTQKTIRIRQVGMVFIPVADQDRSLAFCVDKLGFEKRADFAYGDKARWIEVAPPGSTIAIALVPTDCHKEARGMTEINRVVLLGVMLVDPARIGDTFRLAVELGASYEICNAGPSDVLRTLVGLSIGIVQNTPLIKRLWRSNKRGSAHHGVRMRIESIPGFGPMVNTPARPSGQIG